MKIQSAKAKGRRCAEEVKKTILLHLPTLTEDDILVTSSSVIGKDLSLSNAALLALPVVIECKNVEKISIWESYEQATQHAKSSHRPLTPLLCFKRNRSEVMACLKLDDLLSLIQYAKAQALLSQVQKTHTPE